MHTLDAAHAHVMPHQVIRLEDLEALHRVGGVGAPHPAAVTPQPNQ